MLMALLKDVTRPCHEAVEARLGRRRFTESLEAYGRTLRLFYAFHRPLEEAFARIPGWAGVGIDPQERRKTPLLAADLRRLGIAEDSTPPPGAGPLPLPGDLAEALGVMYVLEGSTLGGRYIRKQVQAGLGLTPGDGASYFDSYGDRVGAMWKAFGAAVDAFATTGAVRDAAVRSAVATFTAFDAWFAADEPGAGRSSAASLPPSFAASYV